MKNSAEQEVDRLSGQLDEITEDVLYDISGHIYGDFDWSFSYNETDVTIGCTIGDWQVSRSIVLSMTNTIDDVPFGDEREWWAKWQEYEDKDELDDHEYGMLSKNEGEYQQVWLNVKSGQIIVKRRVDENGHLRCNGKWEDAITDSANIYDSYYRVDLSVHPKLIAAGYNPRTFDDLESWNNDINTTLPEWQQLILNPFSDKIIEIGGEQMLRIIADKDEHKDYFTAAKICARNKYIPTDKEKYINYLEDCIYLSKDLHNAYYSCPKDLNQAYLKMKKLADRKRKEAREKAELERRLQDERSKVLYAERAARFAHLVLGLSNGVHVIVCPTFEDMVEEGKAMHHCVGKGGYFKKEDTIIMFVRGLNGERISTIEYNLKDFAIRQNRGLQNCTPAFFEQVNALVNANKEKFQAAVEEAEMSKAA